MKNECVHKFKQKKRKIILTLLHDFFLKTCEIYYTKSTFNYGVWSLWNKSKDILCSFHKCSILETQYLLFIIVDLDIFGNLKNLKSLAKKSLRFNDLYNHLKLRYWLPIYNFELKKNIFLNLQNSIVGCTWLLIH